LELKGEAMDRRKNLEDRRERNRDRRKNNTIFVSILGLVFGAFVIVALLFIASLLMDIKIMQTDTLNTLNNMRQDKQSAEESYVLIPEPNGLTDAERDLVERVVAAESRGESIEGQAAVAQVIRDRAYTWDMTITEVCLAKGQFAKPYQGEISIETWIAVSKVFDGGVSVLEIPTTHFASNEPYWTENKVNRGSIGCHTFWY
jgi:hypothetical protein